MKRDVYMELYAVHKDLINAKQQTNSTYNIIYSILKYEPEYSDLLNPINEIIYDAACKLYDAEKMLFNLLQKEKKDERRGGE